MLTKKALGLMIGALLSGALIGGEAAAGQTLADFHSKMGGCASCHGTNAVTAASVPDDERALNAQCQTCHGSYKDIRKTGTEIDPHHSHLGDINCTSCHTAHARPKLVCNDCHTFPNKMPFADAPEATPKAAPDEAAIEAAMKAEPRESYDVVVIGAGSVVTKDVPGGVVAAGNPCRVPDRPCGCDSPKAAQPARKACPSAG